MKKLLSLVLTLSLVLGSFSMAFAAQVNGVNIDGAEKVDAVKAVINLGIIEGDDSGNFNATKEVTRAEFAAMMVRALGIPDSALNEFSTTTFNDMSGYSWATKYIAYCNKAGIMKGDGYGNAMPGRTITPNEAITMILRAIGYTDNAAVLTGVWPANYVQLAQDKGLYEDVTDSSVVNRDNAAQFIYNALTVQKVQVAANGEVSTLWENPNAASDDRVPLSMLNGGLDCYKWPKSDDYGVLTSEEADESVINVRDYVGGWVSVYKTNKDDKIVAVEEVKSDFVRGWYDRPDDKFVVDDVKYNLDAKAKDAIEKVIDDTKETPNSPVKYFMVNGESSNAAGVRDHVWDNENETSIDTALANADYVELAVDLSGKTIKEVYTIAYWEEDDQFLFTSNMINETDGTFNGDDFILDDNDAIDENSFQLRGADELSDIAVDNVIYTYLNSDDEITRIDVGTKTVTGKVTTKSTDIQKADVYTIDGTKYRVASSGDEPSVGDSGTAKLDFNGEIYEWNMTSGTVGNYAILTGTYDGDTGNGTNNTGRKGTIVLFTKDGTSIEREITSSVLGKPTNENPKTTPINSLVEYSLNASGVINGYKVKIDTNGGPEHTDSNTSKAESHSSTKSGRLDKNFKVFAGIAVADNAVVFTYDKDGDAGYPNTNSSTEWEVSKVSDLDTSDPFAATYFIRDGKIVAFIVSDKDAGAKDTVWAVLNDIEDSVDSNGDNVKNFVGFADGAKLSMQTENDDNYGAKINNQLWALEVKGGVIVDVAEPLFDRNMDKFESVYDSADWDSSVIKVRNDRSFEFTADGQKTTHGANTYNIGDTITVGNSAYIYYFDGTEWSLKSNLNGIKGCDKYMLYMTDDELAAFDVVLGIKN